ncbi:MAG: rhodanese-like domain-containing protein [Thiohalomonadaceae bacterium]
MRKEVMLACTVWMIGLGASDGVMAEEPAVKITPDLARVEVRHEGKPAVIQRNQDTGATIHPEYARTSRPCPPSCIQPGTIAPGVETIGELELIEYIKRASEGDESILVVDSRTHDRMPTGTIPGAVSIPWNTLMEGVDGADAFSVAEILVNRFGARENGDGFDFSNAKTLVLFCNGSWCRQSPTNLRLLLSMGYPPAKLKWYRGGMQDWEALGFNTVAFERTAAP